MTRHERPPGNLPAEVLERSDFVAACQRRDLGTILAIAIKWGGAGFTLSHVARRCAMGITQVKDYINHNRQPLSMDIFERTADGLHIPGSMLGISRRPWETTEEAPEKPQRDMETPIHIAESADMPEFSGSQPTPDFGSGEDADIILILAEADRTDIGPGTIESLYTIFDKLCRDYPSAPAPELQQKLKRIYARMMRLRQGRMTFAQHREGYRKLNSKK